MTARAPAGGGSATPLMQQYREIKSQNPGAILFFRMGDFYEMFYDDAKVASRELGLTLTSRNNGGAAEVPLAGVPVKAAQEYLRRLVGKGHRVAVCEQVEDPKLTKTLVKREVIETITPGAVFSDEMLDGAQANYVTAVARASDTAKNGSPDEIGIASADLSTGELRLARIPLADAGAMIARLAPREVLLASSDTSPDTSSDASPETRSSHGPSGTSHTAPLAASLAAVLRLPTDALVTECDAWEFDAEMAAAELERQFNTRGLEGFGISATDAAAVGAAGALLRYLRRLQPGGLPHLTRPVVERGESTMPLDEMTRRNLELIESLRGTDTSGTLLAVLDRTSTPMGERLLRQWLLAPLVERSAIDARLDAVATLHHNATARARMRDALDGVRDIERLASKAAAGRATPREIRALGDSLSRLPLVEQTVATLTANAQSQQAAQNETHTALLEVVAAEWDNGQEVAERIAATLVERPPLAIGEDPTIATGVDAELDSLRTLRDGGKDAIATIQATERERTGIQTLKVGYNRVFGYYLEITNANRHLVPDDYQRRQTLTGAERYVTPALKEYEEKVLTAAERIETRERELFEALRSYAGEQVARWQRVARRVALLDVLASLAETAAAERYVRPELHDGFSMTIKAGRHPVVERMMRREQFIPNDLELTEAGRLVILTGPNMAGKSTILRQIGLIQLMAQIGSFVPATEAKLPVTDRLFTRVGASDNLVRGQSTFMVEMSETSAILHTATRRSLVLLDEIGRGTSTYDGVSIAWSVSEHLHNRIGCKTVFATHYHELTQLEDELAAVRNFTVSVREAGDEILFLHRLIPGGADRSYGIEVGRLAGLPREVITRAKEVLALLEDEGGQMASRLTSDAVPVPMPRRKGPLNSRSTPDSQLGFFADSGAGDSDPVAAELRAAISALDPNRMTPIEALATLERLKGLLGDHPQG